MTVFLTSSPTGPLDGARKADGLDEKNFFVENLRRCWKPNSQCLLIAAAPDAFEENDRMADFFKGALEKSGLTIAGLEVWDDRTEEALTAVVNSYDVILLGGGHVPTENRFFVQLELEEKIRDFEGIVIGISAGTMNSAQLVYAQPELEGEADDPSYERFLPGLGLTKTMILPHYQMTKNQRLDGKRLYEDITFGDSFGRHFLALPDGSYLMIQNGREVIWGEAWEIADGERRQICRDGEHLLYREEFKPV